MLQLLCNKPAIHEMVVDIKFRNRTNVMPLLFPFHDLNIGSRNNHFRALFSFLFFLQFFFFDHRLGKRKPNDVNRLDERPR